MCVLPELGPVVIQGVVFFAYFLLVVVSPIVGTSAFDCLERLVLELTCCVR